MSDAEKEIQQLKKRLIELSEKSSRQGIFTFTQFLALNEQDIFWQIKKDLEYAGFTLYGGTKKSDRVMIRFGDPQELGYEVGFPIKCIHITPLLPKFADQLSHRDFLGAIMNLGIERSTIGDILVGEKEAYVFCMEQVTDFICDNLDKIKHTNVKCVVVDSAAQIVEEEPKLLRIQVSSLRADALIAKVYQSSRSECLELFQTGRVFIDGRLCENNSRILKAGETVNARGYGKFVLNGELGLTRKGKMSVEVLVYR